MIWILAAVAAFLVGCGDDASPTLSPYTFHMLRRHPL